MSLTRLETILLRLSAFLLVLWVTLVSFVPQMGYYDLGWQLAQMRWMVSHHSWLHQDLFSYAHWKQPVIDEYPFFKCLIWLAVPGGELAFAALASCLSALVFVIYLIARIKHQPIDPLFLICLVFSALLSFSRLVLRAELITFLGLALFSFLLIFSEKKPGRFLLPLILFQIAWVNSHSGFILGPALVIGFAFEQATRHWIETRSFPRATILSWLPVAAGVMLACLVNPYGWKRLLLPFFHQNSIAIRSYVTEMQPLVCAPLSLTGICLMGGAFTIVLRIIQTRGNIPWSFLVISLYFLRESFVIQRHLAVYALLVPAIFINPAVLRSKTSWPRCGIALVLTTLLTVLAFSLSLPQIGLAKRWADFYSGKNGLLLNAVTWMKQNHLSGKLLHRSEIGGWLQWQGFDSGETYCDTGFGKYSEDLIHEIGLVCERPHYLPTAIARYHPDFIVLASLGYQWPLGLKQAGWRLIYYSVGGSVWCPPQTHLELPTVTPEQIQAIYERTQSSSKSADSGGAFDSQQILMLQNLGLGSFAFAQLENRSITGKSSGLFWDTVCAFFFRDIPPNDAQLQAAWRWAQDPEALSSSILFRAAYLEQKKEWAKARSLLETLPHQENDFGYSLLAEADLQLGKKEEAEALLRNDSLFQMRNGDRYAKLARLQAEKGDFEEAAQNWSRALYYQPDDSRLRQEARQFLEKKSDDNLNKMLRWAKICE